MSEQELIVEALKIFVKHMESKLYSSQDETRFLQQINEELMIRYCEQQTVVGRCVKKLRKRFATRFVGTM